MPLPSFATLCHSPLSLLNIHQRQQIQHHPNLHRRNCKNPTVIAMQLTIQRPPGTSGYVFTFTSDPAYPKLTLALDPSLVQNRFGNLGTTRVWDPINLVLVSPSYTNYLIDATHAGCTFARPVTRILGSSPLISKLITSVGLPDGILHPLKRNVPYLTFIGLELRKKVEIEFLAEKPHAWGLKFCYRESKGSEWGCISCLLAPQGINPSDVKVWCDTLGESGLERVDATDWNLQDMVEHTFVPRLQQGKLDILIHPFAQSPTTWIASSASFASFHHRSSSLLPRGTFDICKIVRVETWIYPTSSSESGDRNRLPLLEAALRSHGITVYGGFEDGGVKVIELGRGKEYTIHRTTPIASLRVLFSVDKNTL